VVDRTEAEKALSIVLAMTPKSAASLKQTTRSLETLSRGTEPLWRVRSGVSI
jgi:hypothetical protein